MIRTFATAILLSAASTSFVQAAEVPLKADAAYVVVDIESLDDAIMHGTSQPGTLTLGRYDPDKQDIRGGQLSPETALPGKTSPHLTITDKPVVKNKAVRQYVVEIQPDNWVIEGANGTAFSLGSLMFIVRPGQVIDLGVVKPGVDWAEGEAPVSTGKMMMGALLFGRTKPKNERPIRLSWHARGAADLPLPALVSGRVVDAGTFQTGATFGNYLGGLINRVGGRADRETAAKINVAPTSETVPMVAEVPATSR